MGLSWQQAPLDRDPNGTFLTVTPMPERVLYLEPIRRRMSVELGGRIIARSDHALVLFEPARYPVAYFPIGDVDAGVLQPSDHESTHQFFFQAEDGIRDLTVTGVQTCALPI